MIFMTLFLHTLYTSSTRSVSCEGLVKKLLSNCSVENAHYWYGFNWSTAYTSPKCATNVSLWNLSAGEGDFDHNLTLLSGQSERPIRVLFLGLWPSHLNHGGVFDWNAAVTGTSFIPTLEISWNGILAATCGLCFAECFVKWLWLAFFSWYCKKRKLYYVQG